MAKVATASSVPPSSLGIGSVPLKAGSMAKRKTPSELRGEQLKRASVVDHTDESSQPSANLTNTAGVEKRPKRLGLTGAPRYVETRVDGVFPAKKSRFRVVSGKDNAKESPSLEQTNNLNNIAAFSASDTKRQQGISCLENSVASQTSQANEKCSQGKFLNVAELSSAADRSSGSAATIDMGKALKGLAAFEPQASSGLAANSSEKCGDLSSNFTGNFVSECQVPGQKAPLDLTLKTSIRVVSSSSVNWIHRSAVCGTMPFFQHCFSTNQNMTGSQGFKGLHSWMYPQSVLPPSLISALSSSTADGELDFLSKRQSAWEESFRDLYYMLRKNICGLFYVCTSQFVVMFIGGDGSGSSKYSCNAYMSQSTRGLRSLLKEHDVCFSMPLCRSKVEQASTEDLVELSEIEKQNLGQTRRLRSFSDVDNSPESLLVFSGNNDVHGLYDLLLNYRPLLTSLSAMDVPVLCSSVPFQNAALSSPDIKCMEMRRAEHIAASYNGSDWRDGDGEPAQGSPDGLSCSLEISDTFLPPWIICGICALLSSEGGRFEASFVTEPSSIGLNVALKSICEKLKSEDVSSESMQNRSKILGIPEAAVTSSLWSSSLKGLKYCDGSYTASLSPV
ncbi:protein downstream neighbor of Son [Arachis ipaensis]|uniref:protein downstream neighbor of Son n=1 Tax=Arachis ipaensis TaxID=130454 RepID=UPI0007AFBF03|nr:protein downstream neighbor of Son [Arachis ipaensis]XP_016162909.1 protein downstream neighbor of Son [Arachis ipaensis]XP_016162910.1 protein downstream neighbor of Son [Arachis ipaensis]XP_025660082.1 protein downstream neighbor of Son [Arachis hypogaea]QHN88727.1 Protein downstream neighbor of Son [Arachis hypogaea]